MSGKPSSLYDSGPFEKDHQLYDGLDGSSQSDIERTLVSLLRLPSSQTSLQDWLIDDIFPTKFNQLAPHLWMCSTPSHANVPALHEHAVNQRAIVITEKIELHLVWETGRIFIKPLPKYLLSSAFWALYLTNDGSNPEKSSIAKAASGLLRTYYYCIQYESDLRIACEIGLLPLETTWKQWCDFSSSFHEIKNSDVIPRYHYGKVQLARLDWVVRIFKRQMGYYYIDGGYRASFAGYYGPLLFFFGTLSVLLSAMQVGVAVEQLEPYGWRSFWSVCRWFSVISLLLCAVLTCYLLMSAFLKVLDETVWAVKAQYRSRPQSSIPGS